MKNNILVVIRSLFLFILPVSVNGYFRVMSFYYIDREISTLLLTHKDETVHRQFRTNDVIEGTTHPLEAKVLILD